MDNEDLVFFLGVAGGARFRAVEDLVEDLVEDRVVRFDEGDCAGAGVRARVRLGAFSTTTSIGELSSLLKESA